MGNAVSTNSDSKWAETTHGNIAQTFVINSANEGDSEDAGIPLVLTASQSCQLHGWGRPKRMLTWHDIVKTSSLTLRKCLDAGVPAEALRELQPSVEKWVAANRVTLEDVPKMLAWPLHPVKHLRADISDLATARYEPHVLQKLGIDYAYMRRELLMDDDWMHMLKYRPCDWHRFLGFSEKDASDMGNLRIHKVFGMDLCMLKLALHHV